MKVRVSYTVEVDDKFRRAIREYYGQDGLASRKDIQAWYEEWGNTMNDELSVIAYGSADE